ncbi:MAG TPA: glycosyltransferase family 4 protein [Candidatus Nesterenkonia stercoripullorum]|uniref:Glycosyltransferase family 4 protein n=1 Tax=Candidatus Nesterenkonia stercoripullorum TaxID=2838701 RepID=A0A9D1UTQ2_9MICC|nr:glycosyltransferase family 4 protein [Candidatus Nesterenkonia stercoripullorum]
MGFAARQLIWVEPDLNGPSGGSRYNALAQAALEAAGHHVIRLGLAGDWPQPQAQQVHELTTRLRALRGEHPEATVIVDGLIGGCVPELFTGDIAPLADVLLLHLPLGAEPGAPAGVHDVEGRAVRSARAVIATSRWAAADLHSRHGRSGVVVAEPGVERQEASDQDAVEQGAFEHHVLGLGRAGVPRFVVVGSLTPRKNHELLGQALGALLHHSWELVVAGPGAETAFGARMLAELHAALPGRVLAPGALSPEQIAALLRTADLLLLPSHAETYGMVVTEAAVHGIPSFVGAGTGAEEAQDGAGLALATTSPRSWTDAVERWLRRPAFREALRSSAQSRGARVPTWQTCAETISSLAASLRTG